MLRAFLVGVFLVASFPALAEYRVAVLPVQNKVGVKPEEAELITDLLTSEIGKRRDLKVIGAAELRNLVTFEQQKTLLGCADDSCLAEVGAALGVDAIVSGSLGSFGGLFILNLVLMDARKSVVLSRQTEKVQNPRELVNVLPTAASTLMSVIPGGPPPVVVPPPAQPTASTPPPPPVEQAPIARDEAGSALPRRIAGLVVAGGGAVLFVAALGIGLASLGWLVAGRFAVPVLTTSFVKYGGFGVAGFADLIGILSVVVMGVGVVIAVLP